ncbi:hypothetical protein Syun_005279 [Stephania yunnanensis]|uniref:La-related protein 6C n=1 Tax=Stephania yunnanensis TaxID=152371 RepID=A0AAP0Q1K5_9MAGN
MCNKKQKSRRRGLPQLEQTSHSPRLLWISSKPRNTETETPISKIHPSIHQERDTEMGETKKEMMMMSSSSTASSTAGGGGGGFKFNVHAPEFVPRSSSSSSSSASSVQQPISGYYYPCFHLLGANANANAAAAASSPDWFYVSSGQEDTVHLLPNFPTNNSDHLRHKILKQVEYQFSDMSLLASDHLTKHMNKDHEGFVPVSVIASSKKIKSFTSNSNLVLQAIRTSSKLVVSDDGKKVRRKHLFTERDKEDLQSRVVVAENLPEDYSHHNIEKIFSVVGRVQNVRICHPQESNTSRSKSDVVISNKLHALVEYEAVDQAEKAVEKLNDERNWRKGLRVRQLLRRTPRSIIRDRKSDYDHFDTISDEDDVSPSKPLEPMCQTETAETPTKSNVEENSTGSKKSWSRGRGKQRVRGHSNNGNSSVSPSQPKSAIQCEAVCKQTPRGPRMPDGTRGFTMGRGKPLTV